MRGAAFAGFRVVYPKVEVLFLYMTSWTAALHNLPRPYPTFLPYYFSPANGRQIKPEDIEGIQISIGPGLMEAGRMRGHGLGIVSLMLK